MKSSNGFLLSLTALAISAGACSEGARTSVKVVEAMINSELPVGSSSQQIEQFFQKHGLPFSYDRFSKRYNSIIRNVSPQPNTDHAIVIYLYVDDEGKFTRAEIRDSFTAP